MRGASPKPESLPELNGVSGQIVRYDGEKGRWIVDADEVKGLSITARRGGECSYYITTLHRSINLKELIRAQGMDPRSCGRSGWTQLRAAGYSFFKCSPSYHNIREGQEGNEEEDDTSGSN